jgi:hypothetical protein
VDSSNRGVPPAPLLGCSEKSPRQGARAVRLGVDHPWGDPEGDPVDGALIELRRQSGGRIVLTLLFPSDRSGVPVMAWLYQ